MNISWRVNYSGAYALRTNPGAGLVGGLAASRELKAFVESFTVPLALLGGWAMVTGALGALGSGFCWGPGSGWASKVLKYDMALCRGAECKAAESSEMS
jgi:hypothetical protein